MATDSTYRTQLRGAWSSLLVAFAGLCLIASCSLRGAGYDPDSCDFLAEPDEQAETCGREGYACQYDYDGDNDEYEYFCRPTVPTTQVAQDCDADDGICAAGQICWGFSGDRSLCGGFASTCRICAELCALGSPCDGGRPCLPFADPSSPFSDPPATNPATGEALGYCALRR